MNKQVSEIFAVAKELMAGNRQTIAIFPGENPRNPYMFWYLENGIVWYTSGGNTKVNEGTLEEFAAKVRAGRSRAEFVENGQIVSHPPRIVNAALIDELYKSISDAVKVTGDDGYAPGTTEIWYATDSYFREASMGYDWLEKKNLLPNPKELGLTHVFIGKIRESNPHMVMRLMQGEVWSPSGEARNLIRGKGLSHTSMSVGDIVRIENRTYFVDRVGFKLLSSREVTAKYPDSAPTEAERKIWREQAEKRRRHEGIRPRKARADASVVLNDLQHAAKTVSFCRFRLPTSLLTPDDVENIMGIAGSIIEEAKKVVGVCQKDLGQPVMGSTRNFKGGMPISFRVVSVNPDTISVSAGDFGSDKYTSGELERSGKQELGTKAGQLDDELRKVGMYVKDYDVSVGIRNTGLGYGKGPLVLSGIIYIRQIKADRKLVEQAVKKVFG